MPYPPSEYHETESTTELFNSLIINASSIILPLAVSYLQQANMNVPLPNITFPFGKTEHIDAEETRNSTTIETDKGYITDIKTFGRDDIFTGKLGGNKTFFKCPQDDSTIEQSEKVYKILKDLGINTPKIEKVTIIEEITGNEPNFIEVISSKEIPGLKKFSELNPKSSEYEIVSNFIRENFVLFQLLRLDDFHEENFGISEGKGTIADVDNGLNYKGVEIKNSRVVEFLVDPAIYDLVDLTVGDIVRGIENLPSQERLDSYQEEILSARADDLREFLSKNPLKENPETLWNESELYKKFVEHTGVTAEEIEKSLIEIDEEELEEEQELDDIETPSSSLYCQEAIRGIVSYINSYIAIK